MVVFLVGTQLLLVVAPKLNPLAEAVAVQEMEMVEVVLQAAAVQVLQVLQIKQLELPVKEIMVAAEIIMKVLLAAVVVPADLVPMVHFSLLVMAVTVLHRPTQVQQ
jgi:hypothetical protein